MMHLHRCIFVLFSSNILLSTLNEARNIHQSNVAYLEDSVGSLIEHDLNAEPEPTAEAKLQETSNYETEVQPETTSTDVEAEIAAKNPDNNAKDDIMDISDPVSVALTDESVDEINVEPSTLETDRDAIDQDSTTNNLIETPEISTTEYEADSEATGSESGILIGVIESADSENALFLIADSTEDDHHQSSSDLDQPELITMELPREAEVEVLNTHDSDQPTRQDDMTPTPNLRENQHSDVGVVSEQVKDNSEDIYAPEVTVGEGIYQQGDHSGPDIRSENEEVPKAPLTLLNEDSEQYIEGASVEEPDEYGENDDKADEDNTNNDSDNSEDEEEVGIEDEESGKEDVVIEPKVTSDEILTSQSDSGDRKIEDYSSIEKENVPTESPVDEAALKEYQELTVEDETHGDVVDSNPTPDTEQEKTEDLSTADQSRAASQDPAEPDGEQLLDYSRTSELISPRTDERSEDVSLSPKSIRPELINILLLTVITSHIL